MIGWSKMNEKLHKMTPKIVSYLDVELSADDLILPLVLWIKTWTVNTVLNQA